MIPPSHPSNLISQDYFQTLKNAILEAAKPDETYFINYASEHSQFIRVTQSKVRQIGTVLDGTLELTLLLPSPDAGQPGHKKATQSMTLTGSLDRDQTLLFETMDQLKQEALCLPVDPYAESPSGSDTSCNVRKGELLSHEDAAPALLSHSDCDLAGIYASGSVARAMASTTGQDHWFSTDQFTFDFSIYSPSQRAVKETLYGQRWDSKLFRQTLSEVKKKLTLLEAQPIALKPGKYKTYLAPAAFADLVQMFNWGCIGEGSIRQGDSPLRRLRSGEKEFSKLFSLSEDFSENHVPAFNSEGNLAPQCLRLIEQGKLVNALVGSRSAKEYQIPSNGAESSESLRSPSVSPGTLDESQILKELGTGLYLSQLHYLNWSDQAESRITGMTRYACFWVENGDLKGPIQNLRFDDTLFNLLGASLIELTRTRRFIPSTGTYGMRQLGGSFVPGALIAEMNFTL